jgi:hypothetical protein
VMLQEKNHSWCFLGQFAQITSAEKRFHTNRPAAPWQIKLEQGLRS